MTDDFWTHDISLFDGTFKYYRNRKQPVRGKLHVAKETYNKHDALHLERDYVVSMKGDRFYVLMHPYVIEPQGVMTIGFYPKPKQYADQSEAIGQTLGSHIEGYRDVEIGNAQAWYYVEDKLLVLWECFLESRVRDQALKEDKHMKLLWTGFEQWLLGQFPEATRIVTPWGDPIWGFTEYQAFLRTQGFRKGKPGLFTKLVR